jgi:hypothetical protein
MPPRRPGRPEPPGEPSAEPLPDQINLPSMLPLFCHAAMLLLATSIYMCIHRPTYLLPSVLTGSIYDLLYRYIFAQEEYVLATICQKP